MDGNDQAEIGLAPSVLYAYGRAGLVGDGVVGKGIEVGETNTSGVGAAFLSDFSRVREGNIFTGEVDRALEGDDDRALLGVEGGEVEVCFLLLKYPLNGDKRKDEWE